MRRPLLTAGSAAFLTMIFAAGAGLNAGIVLAAFCFIAGAALLFFRKFEWAGGLSLALIVCALSFGMFSVRTVLRVHPALILDGQTAAFTGRVVEAPEKTDGKIRYLVKTSRVDFPGAPQELKILLTANTELYSVGYGDTISGDAALYGASGAAKNRLLARGVYLTGYYTELREIKKAGKRDVYGYAVAAREGVVSALSRVLPGEEGDLLAGLLLGVTGGIDAETSDRFKVSGLSHLLAVSGQQVAILGGLFMALFALFSLNRRLCAALTAVPIVGFMALTGFSWSILRAGLMYLIYLAGICLMREADALTSLGAAALAMLLVNPFAALDVGFQLSASASLGLIVLTPRLHRFMRLRVFRLVRENRPADFLLRTLAQTFSAVLFTLPVTVAVFGTVSVVAPLGNLLAALPVAALLPLTAAGIAAHLLHAPFLSFPIFLLCGLIVKYLLGVTALLSKIPFAVLPAAGGTVAAALAACFILLGAAVLLYRGRPPLRRLALLCVIISLCGALSAKILDSGVTSVRVFDFENGFAVSVAGARQTALVGAGSREYEGARIARSVGEGRRAPQLVLLPSADRLYCGGAAAVCGQGSLVLLPDSGALPYMVESLRKDKPSALYAPCEIALWEDAGARVLGGPEGSFIRFALGGTSVLIGTPGADADILSEDERRASLFLTTAALPGSVSLLEARTAVVSGAGESAQRAAARLQSLGMRTYVTGGAGDILVRTRGNGDLTVSRVR